MGMLRYIPHILLLLFGWKMTIGPGSLILNKLQDIKVCQTKEFSINAYNIAKIPYIRDFLVAFSLPCIYFCYFVLLLIFDYRRTVLPDPLLVGLSTSIIGLSSIKLWMKECFLFKVVTIMLAVVVASVAGAFEGPLVFLGSFFFFIAYSGSFKAIAMSYMDFTRPDSDFLCYETSKEILMSIYSTGKSIMISSWFYSDVTILVGCSAVSVLLSKDKARLMLVLLLFVHSVCGMVCIKPFAQLRVLNLMKPLFISKTKDSPAKELILPLGKSVYQLVVLFSVEGIMALSSFHTYVVNGCFAGYFTFLLECFVVSLLSKLIYFYSIVTYRE